VAEIFAAEDGQRLLLFDGHAHLLASCAGIKESGLFQLIWVKMSPPCCWLQPVTKNIDRPASSRQ